MKEASKRPAIPFPEEIKSDLECMSEETGITQAQLVILAVHSFISNFKHTGSFSFPESLNMNAETKRLAVSIPNMVKVDLEDMNGKTGMSQQYLIIIATHKLTENFKKHGQSIFECLTV